MIVSFNCRVSPPKCWRLGSEWLNYWHRKGGENRRRAADNGDENPSKLCSYHIDDSHRSPECLPSSPSNPQLWDQTSHYALEDSRQERSTLLKNAGMAKWLQMTSNTLC